MKQFGLLQCPYCGKKINPFYAWYLRTQGEYICPSCGGVSNIGITGAAKASGAAVAVIDLVIFVIAMLDQSHEPPFGYLIAMIVPFLLFTILSAFMVRLKKPVLKKKEPPGNADRTGGMPQRTGAQRQPVPRQTVQRQTMPDRRYPQPGSTARPAQGARSNGTGTHYTNNRPR